MRALHTGGVFLQVGGDLWIEHTLFMLGTNERETVQCALVCVRDPWSWDEACVVGDLHMNGDIHRAL